MIVTNSIAEHVSEKLSSGLPEPDPDGEMHMVTSSMHTVVESNY